MNPVIVTFSTAFMFLPPFWQSGGLAHHALLMEPTVESNSFFAPRTLVDPPSHSVLTHSHNPACHSTTYSIRQINDDI